jgi:hypothetical protein
MEGISISATEKEAGSPTPGDMIARNPKNHADQWLVPAKYFADILSLFREGKAASWNRTSKQRSLAQRRRARPMNGGDAKRVCAKLYGPRWLLAERDPTPSSIDGP